jgi:glycosyltransferase involved in cell wall biosynthesis
MSTIRRAIIATRVYPPEVAAASFRMQLLAEALSADAAVTVLTSQAPAEVAEQHSNPVEIVVRRAPVLRDRSGAIRGYVQYLSFDVPLLFRLLAAQGDVIVAEAPPTTGFVALVAAFIRRRRLVYYPGDIWTDAVKSMGGPAALVAVMRWIESRVVRGADRVLAVSPEVAERLVELGAAREDVVLVGNGIDTRVFRPEVLPVPAAHRYFVYTGTMSEWQEPSIFIRALAELADTEVELRFFGQGAAEGELRTLAEKLVPGRVHFGGVVAPEESARWIRGAVGALVSIVPGIGYDFARPTKTYAAAACGTPVLFAGAPTGGAVVREGRLGEAADFATDAVRDAMARLLLEHGSGASESLRSQRAEWVRRNASLEAAGARAADAVRALVQGTGASA